MVRWISVLFWTGMVCSSLGHADSFAAAQQIGRAVPVWGMFEAAVVNDRPYENPFVDVTLVATLQAPEGHPVTAAGFYDGGNVWRLRFMPDRPGMWRYEARFSDGSPGISGTFRCVRSRKHGPLRVRKDNPLWFEHADGTPFYMQAFHLWYVDALRPDVLEKTLDLLRRAHRFNTIVGPHLIPPERLPWETLPDGRVDFSRFNLRVWRNLDRALDLLERRGMVLIPFNIFGGTNGMPRIPTVAQEDLFLRYWTARWGGYWNATYQPTSEWEEGYSEAEILRIGSRLMELDGGRHLISVHALNASSETVQKAEWFSYHTVQNKLTGFDPQKYALLAGLHRRVPKPILAHECLWEGNLYQKEASLDEDNMRRAAWVIALSGGHLNYADEVVPPRRWQRRGEVSRTFSELGSAMEPHGRLYSVIRAVGDCMRSLPFWRLRLHPELSSIGICLADPGRLYLTYSPTGDPVTLDLGEATGSMKVEWLDPRTGRSLSRTTVQGGKVQHMSPPKAGDWALLLHQ